MDLYPESLERLVVELGRLPTIGKKSAERLAMAIVKKDPDQVKNLAQALVDVKAKVKRCRECGNLTEDDLCQVCQSPRRDRSVITVVEDPANLIALEKSKDYKGLYHVLGGLISPMKDISGENIGVDKLLERAGREEVKEIILAISPTVEGETTALFLNQLLKGKDVKVTRIASGIPMGGSLEYFDSETLNKALEERRSMD